MYALIRCNPILPFARTSRSSQEALRARMIMSFAGRRPVEGKSPLGPVVDLA
nr:hypothetical protein [uncultured Bacillus sp.]